MEHNTKTLKDYIQPQLRSQEEITASYDQFDQIELTEEEAKKALEFARQKKIAKLREAAYWEKISKPIEYPKLDATALWYHAIRVMRQQMPEFIIDNSNKPVFALLCQYFAGDEAFEESGYSLKKGIALIGPVGCGKTTLLRCFASNPTNSFVEVSCRKVASDYSANGAMTIEHYSSPKEVYPQYHFGQKTAGFLFDDFGTESIKKHFGNETNVMEEIFLNRYDNPTLMAKTHITANLTSDEIDERYGTRVRSRMREMFNWITFELEAPDRRS